MSTNNMEIRQQSYGEERTTFVDRLRTALVGRSITRKLPSRSDLVALDLGCGYRAGYLKMIQHRLAEGTGVDVSVAPECDSIPHLKFIRSTIDDALPALPSSHYDLILFISVLEHLHSPMVALEHCYRLLKPGGLLMINVPTWYAKPVLEISAFRFGTSPAREMDDHKMYYSKRDIWPLLVKSGFKPSRISLHYQRLGMILFALATRS